MLCVLRNSKFFYYCIPVLCTPLEDPSNGIIECSLKKDEDTTLGEICHYRCSTGFAPAGSNGTRQCQSNGSWSGSATTCERGMLVLPNVTLK